jgi:hypothetical protein
LNTIVGRIVLAAIVLAIGGIIFIVVKPGAAAAKVGDCLNLTGTTATPNASMVSCDDPTATYVVTAQGATCDENEDEFTFTTKGATIKKVCLFYNVKVGDCLTVGTTGAEAKGACTPGASKVTLATTGTADISQCPAESTTSIPNVTRNKLICLAKQK